MSGCVRRGFFLIFLSKVGIPRKLVVNWSSFGPLHHTCASPRAGRLRTQQLSGGSASSYGVRSLRALAPRTSRRRMRSAASPRRRRRRSSGPSRSRSRKPVRVKTMPQRYVHAPRGTALQGPAQGSPPCFKPVRRPRGGATQTVGDNYDFHELLGKGAFGFVYRATHRRSGIEYAVSTRVARGFSRPPVLESQNSHARAATFHHVCGSRTD